LDQLFFGQARESQDQSADYQEHSDGSQNQCRNLETLVVRVLHTTPDHLYIDIGVVIRLEFTEAELKQNWDEKF
jgi:hypothetical protein